jgi:hypothetical protein
MAITDWVERTAAPKKLKITSVNAYRRLYRFLKKQEEMRKLPTKGNYAKFSKMLIDQMPTPDKASPAEQQFIAKEVFYGLLEWSYHRNDSQGTPMHEYARMIIRQQEEGKNKKLAKTKISVLGAASFAESEYRNKSEDRYGKLKSIRERYIRAI